MHGYISTIPVQVVIRDNSDNSTFLGIPAASTGLRHNASEELPIVVAQPFDACSSLQSAVAGMTAHPRLNCTYRNSAAVPISFCNAQEQPYCYSEATAPFQRKLSSCSKLMLRLAWWPIQMKVCAASQSSPLLLSHHKSDFPAQICLSCCLQTACSCR